jgi:hypothetical protein
MPQSKTIVSSCASACLVWLAACPPRTEAERPLSPPSAIQQSEPERVPERGPEPPSARPARPGAVQTAALDGDQNEYLVVTRSNELVLRTRERVVSVLAGSVRNAMYDPKLELVWLEGESLSVVDLRKPGSKPIPIVRDWPGSPSLTISHPASMVTTNESCDVAELANLSWDEHPTLKVIAEQDSELKLESMDWLRAQLSRPVRAVPDSTASDVRYVDARVLLPEKVSFCVDQDECGRAVRFGAYDLELVLAVTLQGDCWHPYCVFRDPTTGVISSPLIGDRWRGTSERAGTCGEYHFDRGGKTFLVEGRLCGADGTCQDAGGYALGWRIPGLVVGTPDDNSMGPDATQLEQLRREQQDRERGEGE